MKNKKEFIEYLGNLIDYYSNKPKRKLFCQYINQLKQLINFLKETEAEEGVK